MVNYDILEKEKWLPFDRSFLSESVFVMWKLRNRQPGYTKPEWHKSQLFNTPEDREFINRLAWEDSVSRYFGHIDGYGKVDYVLINSDGEILKKNFDAKTVLDENDYIHIVSESKDLTHLVKAIEAKANPNVYYFFEGKNFEELNKKVKNAVERKSIKPPKNFNKKSGLTDKPIDLETENTIGL